MTLTPEEVKELKSQLAQQIQHLPEAQKQSAQQQIDSLSAEALEEMIKQQQERNSGNGEQKTVFRMIIDKEIDSIKIGENEDSIAVLEINPISKGHTLVLPKSAVTGSKTIPTEVFVLAKKVSEKLIQGLEAKSVEMITETKFGEKIINLIPIYDSQLDLKSPRKKAEKTDLEDTAKKLEPKPKTEVIKIKTEATATDQIVKRKRRVP